MANEQNPAIADGIFDNRAAGRREVWQDGRLRRYALRNAVGCTRSPWREMRKCWGTYPDLPSNALLADGRSD